MTRIPPLLPDEVLARVLRVSRTDGFCILFIAGFFALLSAISGDRVGALIGLLIAGGGAVELHGGGLLQHGHARGLRWLINSQILLLAVILAYCQFRLVNVDVSALRLAITDEAREQIASLGMREEEFLQFTNRLMFRVIAIASIIYQGGMILYYWKRREAVERALEES